MPPAQRDGAGERACVLLIGWAPSWAPVNTRLSYTHGWVVA